MALASATGGRRGRARRGLLPVQDEEDEAEGERDEEDERVVYGKSIHIHCKTYNWSIGYPKRSRYPVHNWNIDFKDNS